MSYKCSYCGKEYEMKSYFDAHVAEHEDDTALEDLLSAKAHALFEKEARGGLRPAKVKELADEIREL